MDASTRARGVAGLFLTSLLLTACSGDYSGGTATGTGGGGSAQARSLEEHFAGNVQPRLDFCRSCHVPGGVADVENGRDMMLSADRDADLENLRASWQRLGENNPTSRVLLMASGQETPHSGGAPWPQGSDAYQAMDLLLQCFADPAGCAAVLAGYGGAVIDDRPLLGSSYGGHAWFDYCDGKTDDAVLPTDPRALVVPGANAGKAVYFNAYWKDCHRDPAAVGEEPPARTCGELRAMTAQGRALIEGNGAIGAGWYFGGSASDTGNLTAEEYNTLWQTWGLDARPDNFDRLVAERYGMGLGTDRNPYPLPGEDPNQTNGGSGQLPTGLTQLREADGRWTGKLGTTCHVCHSGQISGVDGVGSIYGNANSLSEFGQMDLDLGHGYAGLPPVVPIIVGKTRGTNNALALQIITLLLAQDIRPLDPNFIAFALLTPNGGSLDTPAWWNVGHRPVKFQDGFLAMDALRSDLGFYLPGPGPAGFDWLKQHARAGDTYLMSLKAPPYPGAIDTALAEQGAILFHSKDLWADGLNQAAPRPAGGNGSCASCHGAYSPRYVNDPAYLETPALEGVASYIVPRDLIGTDPKRVDSDSEAAEQYGKENFFAYPETLNDDPNLDCSTQNRAEIRQGREPGYLAPPLYGVWATAPYFHNGSVPNVWEVLDPSARQTIWRRVSTPTRVDQLGLVMGFDTDFGRAYDTDRLGWKYDTLACGDDGTTPYLDCSPNDTDPVFQDLLNILNSSNPYLWYLGAGPSIDEQLETRKIYNTRMYGQGNQGHAFTAVLSDQERRAVIEYLKTL
ncbi:MAG: hypothetical protein PHP86_09465 [Nevskiales bacterium]|nr:hypothetical protein [Nevskiales bacterium]